MSSHVHVLQAAKETGCFAPCRPLNPSICAVHATLLVARNVCVTSTSNMVCYISRFHTHANPFTQAHCVVLVDVTHCHSASCHAVHDTLLDARKDCATSTSNMLHHTLSHTCKPLYPSTCVVLDDETHCHGASCPAFAPLKSPLPKHMSCACFCCTCHGAL